MANHHPPPTLALVSDKRMPCSHRLSLLLVIAPCWNYQEPSPTSTSISLALSSTRFTKGIALATCAYLSHLVLRQGRYQRTLYEEINQDLTVKTHTISYKCFNRYICTGARAGYLALSGESEENACVSWVLMCLGSLYLLMIMSWKSGRKAIAEGNNHTTSELGNSLRDPKCNLRDVCTNPANSS